MGGVSKTEINLTCFYTKTFLLAVWKYSAELILIQHRFFEKNVLFGEVIGEKIFGPQRLYIWLPEFMVKIKKYDTIKTHTYTSSYM